MPLPGRRSKLQQKNASIQKRSGGTPDRIRTGVSALRGPRPRPLDNGGTWLGNKDLNLDSTSQSRKCCRYTIPQRSAASHCKKHYTKTDMLCQGVFFIFLQNSSFPVSGPLSQESPDEADVQKAFAQHSLLLPSLPFDQKSA